MLRLQARYYRFPILVSLLLLSGCIQRHYKGAHIVSDQVIVLDEVLDASDYLSAGSESLFNRSFDQSLNKTGPLGPGFLAFAFYAHNQRWPQTELEFIDFAQHSFPGYNLSRFSDFSFSELAVDTLLIRYNYQYSRSSEPSAVENTLRVRDLELLRSLNVGQP